MLDKVLTSSRHLSTKDYLLFPDEECENEAKTELVTPDDFYQISNHNSNNLFLHLIISSVYLNTLTMNCKNKPKAIGISQ